MLTPRKNKKAVFDSVNVCLVVEGRPPGLNMLVSAGILTFSCDAISFFALGEDDSLNRHEGKHGLPKTPYPTTGEEEERIQSSLFLH